MKQTIIRIITGVLIVAIGIGALLNALNIYPFWETFKGWWPLLVVLAGGFVLIGDLRRNYLWGIVLLVVGSLLFMKEQGVVDFNVFSLIFPIILIAAGLSVLIHTKSRPRSVEHTAHVDDVSVIFSGSETYNKSSDYRGGRATAIFGGATIDLRDAKLKKQATLDFFVLCGGVELRVPRDWKVVSHVTPIAGGIENKAQGGEAHDGPVLVLTGTVTFGGVEVKT